VVVDFCQKAIEYYDSMGNYDIDVEVTIRKFLADEYRNVMNLVKNFDDFKSVFVRNIPKQDNSNDCGVYAVKYLEWSCADIRPGGHCGFKREDIPYFRRRMALEIIIGRILE